MCIEAAMLTDLELKESLSPEASAEYARLEAEHAELEKHPDAKGSVNKQTLLFGRLRQNERERREILRAHGFRKALFGGTKTEPKSHQCVSTESEPMADEQPEQEAASEAAVTRMNISLPVPLKAEMDAAAGVNWSKVAREAFKAKLLELQSTQKGNTMEDAIKRLKAAALLEGEENMKAGKAAGEEWAKDYAKPSHLKRLLKAVEGSDGNGNGTPDYYVGVYENGVNNGAAIGVSRDITGRELDWNEVSVFWAEALGDDDAELIEDQDFAIGFVTGALEVWEAVLNAR